MRSVTVTGEKRVAVLVLLVYIVVVFTTQQRLQWSKTFSKGGSHPLFNPTSLVTARCGSSSLYKLVPVIRLISASDSITTEFQVHRSAGGL